jgi:hypothetical protein
MKKCAGMVALVLLLTVTLSAADNALTAQEKAQGWRLLFDGKSLNGWDAAQPQSGRGRGAAAPGGGGGAARGAAPPAQPGAMAQVGSNPRACATPEGKAEVPAGSSHWEVVNGAVSPCGDPAGYLTSTESFKDFVLSVEFLCAEDTNSGVFVRSPNGSGGYEVQIWKVQPAGYNTGGIVNTGKPAGEFNFKPNEWNRYEITADGDHLVLVLNGQTTLDVHDKQFAEGRIRFQYQKFPIDFRNIKIRPITH